MTLQDFLRELRHGWWIVMSCLVIGATSGWVLATLQTPEYRSQATLFVTTTTDGASDARQADNSFVQSRVTTYADLARTSAVLNRASAALGAVEPEELRGSLSSGARESTNLIDVTATAPTAEVAAQRANAVAQALAQTVNLLEAPTGVTPASDGAVILQVVQEAVQEDEPVAPDVPRTTAVGVLVGLAAGVGFTVMAQALSGRLRSPRDVAGISGLVPTSVPEAQGNRRREAYRALRSSLRYSVGSKGSVAVAPVQSGTSARELAEELARAFGEIGASTLLIDADFRPDRSRRRSRVEVTPAPGLAEVLDGSLALTAAIGDGPAENTSKLGSGAFTEVSSQLLSSSAMAQVMDQTTQTYDYVIVVAPPLLERSEAAVLASQVQATVLRMQAQITRRSDLLFALERVYAVGETTVSLVLDGVSRLDMQPARSRYSQSTAAAPDPLAGILGDSPSPLDARHQ